MTFSFKSGQTVVSKGQLKRMLSQENVLKAVILGKSLQQDLRSSADESDSPLFGSDFVVPRFTPLYWMELLERSTRLRGSIHRAARSAVGLGVSARIKPEVEEELRTRRNLLISAMRDRLTLRQFLQHPNLEMLPLQEVLFRAQVDVLGAGTGYLEVIEADREAGKPIVGVTHAKTVGMRVHRTRQQYCRNLLHNCRKVYFRAFDDPDPDHRFIDRDSGQWYSSWPKKLPDSRRGTSIISLKSYCPLDDFYGEPISVTAVNAIVTNHLEAIWNISLLRNNANVPFAVIVKNANLSADTREQLDLFVQIDVKGEANAGRVIVIEPDMNTVRAGETPDIKIEPLKLGVTEDGGFLKLREANGAEIDEAVGVFNVLAAGKSATRATAQVARQTSQEQNVEPWTVLWETVLNQRFAPKFGRGYADFHIKRPTLLDAGQRAAALQKLKGVLTAAEVRPVVAEILQMTLDPERTPKYSDVLLEILPELVRALATPEDAPTSEQEDQPEAAA